MIKFLYLYIFYKKNKHNGLPRRYSCDGEIMWAWVSFEGISHDCGYIYSRKQLMSGDSGPARTCLTWTIVRLSDGGGSGEARGNQAPSGSYSSLEKSEKNYKKNI